MVCGHLCHFCPHHYCNDLQVRRGHSVLNLATFLKSSAAGEVWSFLSRNQSFNAMYRVSSPVVCLMSHALWSLDKPRCPAVLPCTLSSPFAFAVFLLFHLHLCRTRGGKSVCERLSIVRPKGTAHIVPAVVAYIEQHVFWPAYIAKRSRHRQRASIPDNRCHWLLPCVCLDLSRPAVWSSRHHDPVSWMG